MKAIFEVEFDPDLMMDIVCLKSEYGGSWLKAMQYLYEQEGIGIFDNDLKLIEIKERHDEAN